MTICAALRSHAQSVRSLSHEATDAGDALVTPPTSEGVSTHFKPRENTLAGFSNTDRFPLHGEVSNG
jgi:hypothetical protein